MCELRFNCYESSEELANVLKRNESFREAQKVANANLRIIHELFNACEISCKSFMFNLFLVFNSWSQRLTLLTTKIIIVNWNVEILLSLAINYDIKSFCSSLLKRSLTRLLLERSLISSLFERSLSLILEKLQAKLVNKNFDWNYSFDTRRDELNVFQSIRRKNHKSICSI